MKDQLVAARFGDFFHVGVVVENIDAAMGEFGSASGVSWRSLVGGLRMLWTPEGERLYTPTAVYTQEGPPFLELIQTVPETIWDRPGLHHMGFWSDDIEAGARGLEELGMERVSAVFTPDHDLLLATYHRTPSGSYLELIRSESRARLVG
jgi:glyoxalase/bleomycin resistance protein/dioxygenase superfamily protein